MRGRFILRRVCCMICAWVWDTGALPHNLAMCPRCNRKAGVENFWYISEYKVSNVRPMGRAVI